MKRNRVVTLPLLESALILSVISLIVQLSYRPINSWLALPGPGSPGVVMIDVMGERASLAGNCFVFLPEAYKEDAVGPLLLYLHGAGDRGETIDDVRQHGLPHFLYDRGSYPMIVVAPQCRERCYWQPEELAEFLRFVETRFAVDPNRIYVLGESMGGYGAWALAAEAPDKFAAVVPLCGGGDTSSAPKLVNLPIWAFHGEDDTVVPPSESQEMVDAANEAGGRARLTILPGRGHDIRDVAWKNGELIEWMLRRRREAGAQP